MAMRFCADHIATMTGSALPGGALACAIATTAKTATKTTGKTTGA
jgi:hypothetical protein